MSTMIYKHTFKIGQSVFVLPTVDQLQSSMSEEISRIINRASYLMFIKNPKYKDKNYEYCHDESRLTVFLKPNRKQITRSVSFLTMKEFPIMFACPHYLYELNMPYDRMFKNLFLLLKFDLYDEWLPRDQRDKQKIYRWMNDSPNNVFDLRPNFDHHLNFRTGKWHKSLFDFERHLQFKKIRTKVLMVLEKACFEVDG